MRLFIALPTPDGVEESILLDTAALRGKYPDLKWVRQDALHLTLVFLGEAEKEQLEPVCRAMDAAGRLQEPFQLQYRGLGTFPRRGQPRVLFLPVIEGEEECSFLHQVLVKRIGETIEVDRRKFTPHLTLARVKNSRNWPDVRSEGLDITAAFEAHTIVLFRSYLKPGGAEYEVLYSTQLGRDGDRV